MDRVLITRTTSPPRANVLSYGSSLSIACRNMRRRRKVICYIQPSGHCNADFLSNLQEVDPARPDVCGRIPDEVLNMEDLQEMTKLSYHQKKPHVQTWKGYGG